MDAKCWQGQNKSAAKHWDTENSCQEKFVIKVIVVMEIDTLIKMKTLSFKGSLAFRAFTFSAWNILSAYQEMPTM